MSQPASVRAVPVEPGLGFDQKLDMQIGCGGHAFDDAGANQVQRVLANLQHQFVMHLHDQAGRDVVSLDLAVNVDRGEAHQQPHHRARGQLHRIRGAPSYRSIRVELQTQRKQAQAKQQAGQRHEHGECAHGGVGGGMSLAADGADGGDHIAVVRQ